MLDEIRQRFADIIGALRLSANLEPDFAAIEAHLRQSPQRDYMASRGEYLNSKLLAAYLGFRFVDAAQMVLFRADGSFDPEATNTAIGHALVSVEHAVIPGFYGAMPDGTVHTFSRGGSDVTGSVVARAVGAGLYENWTDVPGILAADPKIVKRPVPIETLSYPELQLLSAAGTQVLHESAVAPVRERQIPLHIRSTFAPDAPGTRIGFDAPASLSASGVIGFAGRRPVSMLRVIFPENTEETALWEVRACLNEHRIETFHSACGVEGLCLLLSSGAEADALHAAAEQLREHFSGAQVKLRENLAVLLALCRSTKDIPKLSAAIEASGAPVHHLVQTPPGAMFCVNDSQYEQALRAAYAASRQLRD